MFGMTKGIMRGFRALGISPLERLLATVVILVGAFAGPLGTAPAHAATGDLVCTTNIQINFTPPLTATNTTAQASATAGLVLCSSPNGSYPDLASATATSSGTATSAGGFPCSLLLTMELKFSATWSPTGQQSEGTFTINTDPSGGTVTFSGVVTNGVLAGDSVTLVGLVLPNADCAVKGLSSLTLAPSLVIAG